VVLALIYDFYYLFPSILVPELFQPAPIISGMCEYLAHIFNLIILSVWILSAWKIYGVLLKN